MNKYTSKTRNKNNYSFSVDRNIIHEDKILINNIDKNNIVFNISDTLSKDRSPEKINPTPHIGLIVDDFHNINNPEIWYGIKDAVNEYKGKLISYIAGSLDNYHNYKLFNSNILNLVKSKCIVGILILASKMNLYNKKYFNLLVKSFKNIPIVNIGNSYKNISSIMIDNENGIRNLLLHLINVHDCKKIAFICGAEKNLEIKEKITIYKDVLNNNNIAVNDDLIVYGRNDSDFGKTAVKKLLDERKTYFDAVVGSNNLVTISAIDELRKRGIDVPGEVIVDGIDCVIKNQDFTKNHTTVNRSIYKMGYKSVEMLYSIINKKHKIINNKIPYLDIYKSCRYCFKEEKYITEIFPLSLNNAVSNTLLPGCLLYSIMRKMNSDFENKIPESILHNWAKRLFFMLFNELNKKIENNFLITLEKVILESGYYKIQIQHWNKIISYLFYKIIPKLKLQKNNKCIMFLLKDSFEIINKVIIKKYEYSFFKSNKHSMILNLLKKKLLQTCHIKELKKIIKEHFFDLEIKRCYIFLLNKRKQEDIPRMCIAYEDNKILNLKKNDSYFLYRDIFCNYDYKNENPYLIHSLSYKNKIFGHVVLEIEHDGIQESEFIQSKFIIYESLIMELSDCIRRMIVYYKKKRKTKFKINKKKWTETESKYKKINLPKNEAEKYYRQLLDCMENEKPYLNPELTPDHLAEKINISFHNLSYIINVYSNVNFYDFVNKYRVESAKQYLLNMKVNTVNILNIAYDSGFNSKSTFYRVFKDSTQMTPLQYMRKHKNKPV